MSQHVDFERIKVLADEYTAHAPSQETPTCTLILGIVSLADRDFSQGQCGDDCIRINLLDAWSVYSGKPAETFIAVEIGGLEQIQLERIHFLMRLLGYRIEMSLLGSEGHGEIWRSLDDAERRLCYLRDITSYELVLYMFQDIVGMSPEEMLESFGNADTIAISSPDATTRVQADITEMRRLFATAESSQDAL